MPLLGSAISLSHVATRFVKTCRCPLISQCRTLATLNDAHHAARVPMSRYDQDHFVDFNQLQNNVRQVRDKLKRPLTYSEKALYSHLDIIEDADIRRGKSYLKLRPSRIACQDATAQMALIQFISAGLDKVAVPTTVHCDHLVVARLGDEEDLRSANTTNREVYEFMMSACQRYGAGFWKPGAGIIHQIVLENYAYPGGLMIGTDSHTPNAGGLGMAAIGVGGSDAVDVMAGLPWELKCPNVIGVRLTGKLSKWAAPKDVILHLASILTVKGATGSIVEYFGDGVQSLSCTGMATICNMGAETGATTSIFPYTRSMSDYLEATGRGQMRKAASAFEQDMQADQGAEYDRVIDIDLSKIEPLINGPLTPDFSTPVSRFKQAIKTHDWPNRISAGLIGSCTNSSFEDMSRAANLAQQALDAGLKPKSALILSPGSERTRRTLDDARILDVFEQAGGTLLANACGPCCGSWDRQDMPKGEENSIITSYNRNFTGRLDSNPATRIFLSSPETVIAKVFAGTLDFDPSADSIQLDDGGSFQFQPPPTVDLPSNGYREADDVYTHPPSDRSGVEVEINPRSERIQRLTPFRPWDGRDFIDLPILVKVKGKCTTDHITPAGPWFRYRGHLANISNNTLIGSVNAASGKVNRTVNVFTGAESGIPETARDYLQRNQQWVVIADHNYGEGSSREHAALQPRFLNSVAIIAKSFARIHETNLKKQGMLALTFANEYEYDRVQPDDRITLHGLADLAADQPVRMVVRHGSGETEEMLLNHTFNQEQVEYFRAGSALNVMAQRASQGQVDDS